MYSINTTQGTIKVKLYDKTPLHRANFDQLVKEHAYDGVLFHRIIEGFMIQTGDLSTKPTPVNKEGELIPAEFVPEYFHKKGALAAARTGDAVNPQKKSSFSQFYIVQGRAFKEEELSGMENFGKKVWTPEQKEVYKTTGGTPFLDQDYTVFGEVVAGLDVVDKIAAVQTNARDYPLEDVRIVSIKKD
ncbi:peptidyl-prolyl cis-trans isomerase [Bacteroidia bacterium]|nr:peptidyl-prolyl cis-trans isomerase [Bacteroidia bacterium]